MKVGLLSSLLLILICSLTMAAERRGPFVHQRTNTPKKDSAMIGRYLYLGNVPRFRSEDLEIFVSKVGLTSRVKAWVPVTMPDQYGTMLLQRWRRIRDAFQDSSLSMLPIVNSVPNDATSAFAQGAAPLMRHELEGHGVDLYQNDSPATLRDRVLTALLRAYLNNDRLTLADGIALSDKADRFDVARSRELFRSQWGSRFTAFSGHPGALGYLTLVYPIAAHAEGPFAEPHEATLDVGSNGGIEARWWSDKFKDLYGGFPFILIDGEGDAFHGPISNRAESDVWYLRRDFASHGCFRMDSSDVMEFRELLPADALHGMTGGNIKVHVMEWLDVADADADGHYETSDVAYYDFTQGGTPEEQRQRFQETHYLPYHFDMASGTFSGIPKYDTSSGTLVRGATWNGIPVKTFPYRTNRIVQYREAGTALDGYDDTQGKYPPQYFSAF